MWQKFTWRGEPIPDIEKWASARGERMVHYKLTITTVYGPEVTTGKMPESFWNSLLINPKHHYEEIDEC